MIELKTPLKKEDIKKLRLGDELVLTGSIFTARDKAHIKAIKEGLPFNAEGLAVYHCGPIIKGKEVIAAGPTTSSRMNSLEADFIKKTKIKAVIGKAGMDEKVVKAMKNLDCVYLAFTGGAAQLAAKGIKNIEGVYWKELGMAEAIWLLKAEKFGPMIVAIADGKSLFIENNKKVDKNLAMILRENEPR